jgi:hypothetical protein
MAISRGRLGVRDRHSQVLRRPGHPRSPSRRTACRQPARGQGHNPPSSDHVTVSISTSGSGGQRHPSASLAGEHLGNIPPGIRAGRPGTKRDAGPVVTRQEGVCGDVERWPGKACTGLQNRWTACCVVGGFDSRPPPHPRYPRDPPGPCAFDGWSLAGTPPIGTLARAGQGGAGRRRARRARTSPARRESATRHRPARAG